METKNAVLLALFWGSRWIFKITLCSEQIVSEGHNHSGHPLLSNNSSITLGRRGGGSC